MFFKYIKKVRELVVNACGGMVCVTIHARTKC